ncbi:MAG: hypothetical protein M1828_000921 [Chrysothrix sp. TS-e1954]|nr:MAG: hypothetical protein M1828_000921 [Chrysothrix sp. TS-e1954]
MSKNPGDESSHTRTDSKKRKRADTEHSGSKTAKKSKSKARTKPFTPSDAPLPPVVPAELDDTPAESTIIAEAVDGVPAPAQEETSSNKSRFIAFIGNLPFTATTESVAKHFVKIKPTSIRHLAPKATDALPKSHKKKDPKPTSKGFAFLEFDNYDRMGSCLKLYHHSTFDDGISKPRKINVELTAGGGGRGQGRKEKLKAKNEKLQGQRQRKAKQEEKDGTRKPRSKKKDAVVATDKSEEASEYTEQDDGADTQGDIHPSRIAQMNLQK